MTSPRVQPLSLPEMQRLKTLVPPPLESLVAVVRSAPDSPLVKTRRTRGQGSVIEINPTRWQNLSRGHQDLLFWHQVARIEQKTVPGLPWDLAVLVVGLGAAGVELGAQNVLQLSLALLAVCLGAYRLYQRQWGEQGLREATAADQGAMKLALKFGYTPLQAHTALKSLLIYLGQQTTNQLTKGRYQARLRVIEMCSPD